GVEYQSAAGERQHGAQDHGDERLVRASDPQVGAQPEWAQRRVREAVWIGVEDPAPHHRHEDRRVHQRQIEKSAVEDVRPRTERLYEASYDEGEGDLRRDDDRRVQDRVSDRLYEDGIGREGLEVREPDELAAGHPRVL